MSYAVLPGPLSPCPVKRDTEHYTQVFTALCHLTSVWRDDPERLAMALAAGSLFGFPAENFSMDVAKGDPRLEQWLTQDQALELMEKALFRKNAKVLRAKAYGLLMVLVEFAPAVERDRLHAVQVESCVIECRALPVEERLAMLRQLDAHPMAAERESDAEWGGEDSADTIHPYDPNGGPG